MAFFGITSLGPPNVFQTSLVNALGINTFSEEEFKISFEKVDKDSSGYITSDEVEDLLFETYGFPPLEEEVKMFMEEFDTNKDGKVTWDEFRAAMESLRDKVNNKASGAKEYKSFTKMKEDRYKHRRMENNLQDKYKVPMTFNQSVGFRHNDEISRDIVKQDKKPIRKCQETKYAEAMIKTGIHFQ